MDLEENKWEVHTPKENSYTFVTISQVSSHTFLKFGVNFAVDLIPVEAVILAAEEVGNFALC